MPTNDPRFERLATRTISAAGSLRWTRWVIAAVAGAAVVHVVEYHLGLGFKGNSEQRLAAIEYMLYHCPLRGPVGVILLLALLAVCGTLALMRSQLRTLQQLGGTPPSESGWLTRVRTKRVLPSISRLTGTWLLLGAAQLGIFLVIGHFMPMEYVMQMHGGHMLMGIAPPIPPIPLSFALALPVAYVLTMVERRLSAIAAAIAHRVRMLFARARSSPRPRLLARRVGLNFRFGPALFSRPPPAVELLPFV